MAAASKTGTRERIALVIKLHPVPHSAGIARQFVKHHLLDHGAAGYLDVALIVVSELVTNAIRATRAEVWLRLTPSPEDRRPLIEVWDSGLEVPQSMWDAAAIEPGKRFEQCLTALQGRGLALVRSLTEKWGVGDEIWAGVPGKVVWAVLKDPEDASGCTGGAAVQPEEPRSGFEQEV